MVKSRRLEASKGAQQTFARSSPRLPGAEYKLLFSYPVRLHLQTWYLFARCTVCFKFLFLVVVSYINLEECTRSVLGQNLNCACAHNPEHCPRTCVPLCVVLCPCLVWPPGHHFVPPCLQVPGFGLPLCQVWDLLWDLRALVQWAVGGWAPAGGYSCSQIWTRVPLEFSRSFSCD